jgi:hypothetical protein
MKQNQIKDLPKLSIDNYENIFNVYQEEDGMYYYNLLNSIQFPPNLPATLFNKYTVKTGDTWPFISYKAYKNPNLWWIIILANNIQNPVMMTESGTEILIPVIDVVKEVLGQITK